MSPSLRTVGYDIVLDEAHTLYFMMASQVKHYFLS